MSESAKADADKGRDIKAQQVLQDHDRSSLQRFYDGLLDARIRLQKAMIASNSLPQGDTVDKYVNRETANAINAAREQAYSLFMRSSELRKVRGDYKLTDIEELLPATTLPSKVGLKRKFEESSLAELMEISESFRQQYTPTQPC